MTESDFKLSIVRKPEFSAGKWRLVDNNNHDMYYPEVIRAHQSEPLVANMPICADTKDALIDRILGIMVSMATKLKAKQPVAKPNESES
jgi:hypothetical protein